MYIYNEHDMIVYCDLALSYTFKCSIYIHVHRYMYFTVYYVPDYVHE